MPFHVDYKEEVIRLISENYIPADSISKEFQKTTRDIVQDLSKILPEGAVDEHMVYEALLEMKFEPKEDKPLEFHWYFKRA